MEWHCHGHSPRGTEMWGGKETAGPAHTIQPRDVYLLSAFLQAQHRFNCMPRYNGARCPNTEILQYHLTNGTASKLPAVSQPLLSMSFYSGALTTGRLADLGGTAPHRDSLQAPLS